MGRFYEPTIIANVNQGMKCQIQQKHGPIVGVQAVDSPGEAAKIINSCRYGMASYVFTDNESTMNQHSRSLKVGTIHFNDVPIMGSCSLPQTGRGRSSHVFKGANKHVLRSYCNIKSFNRRRFGELLTGRV